MDATQHLDETDVEVSAVFDLSWLRVPLGLPLYPLVSVKVSPCACTGATAITAVVIMYIKIIFLGEVGKIRMFLFK